jgi:hypothetical protein
MPTGMCATRGIQAMHDLCQCCFATQWHWTQDAVVRLGSAMHCRPSKARVAWLLNLACRWSVLHSHCRCRVCSG